MAPDPEIQAMGSIADALTGLDEDGIVRVLKWAAARYGVPVASPSPGKTRRESPLGGAEQENGKDDGGDTTYEDFAALYDAANPTTGVDRVLVVGYWFQVVQGEADLEAAPMNRELKHMGYASTNITRDLDALIAKTPRLVTQTRKTGTSRQARKKYRLTTEGIRAVQRMLRGGGGDVDE